MIYNNGYPATYQQSTVAPITANQQQPMMNQQTWQYQPPIYSTVPMNQMQNNMYQQNQQIDNGMKWVQGEAAAKAYSVAPNTTLPLWDSERDTIYLKSVDAVGRPSMTILDYKVREEENTEASIQQQTVPVEKPIENEYITREEFEQRIAALKPKQNNQRKEQRDNAKSTV